MQNHLVKSIAEVTCKLSEMAAEGYDLGELIKIWSLLPPIDESLSTLEAVNECTLQISDLVDDKFPQLSVDMKTAKKYRLMASLLSLKADQLEKSYLVPYSH